MFKNKKYFFMSAKRPRPAIPVLVHVDNPAEVGSVVVDTSTIEGKMDTVITNQNRIYDKIPTSSGGGSADLTTVNEKITTLATAVGPANSTTGDRNLIGHVINLVGSIGDFNAPVSPGDGTVKAFLNNIRDGIGNSTNPPTTTGSSVRDLLTAIKTATGTTDSTTGDHDLLGLVNNLRSSIGVFGTGLPLNDTTVRSILYNIRTAIGSGSATPTLTGTSVRDLLTQIKENTASGGGGGGGGGSADLTTVNEKTTALAAAIGSASDDSSTVSVIGLLKSITDKY